MDENAATRGPTRVINFGQATTEVTVGEGPTAKAFNVDKGLLISRSPFFARVLGPVGELDGYVWVDDEVGVILPRDDPKLFRLYLHLLLMGTLPVIPGMELMMGLDGAENATKISNDLDDELTKASNLVHCTMVRLYLLCNRLGDITSKNLVLKAFVTIVEQQWADKFHRYPGANPINLIYDGTPVDSPFRRCLVDLYAHYGSSAWLDNPHEDIEYDFLLDLSKRALELRNHPMAVFDEGDYLEDETIHIQDEDHDIDYELIL